MFKKFKKSLFCGRNASLFFFFYNPLAKLSLLFCREIKKEELKKPPKILLCCQASLGDVLLASSIAPSIRAKWPKAEIGFLCTKESSAILKMQREIDYIHEAPRWLIPGKGKFYNLYSLFFHNLMIYPRIVLMIKRVNYDLSLELHPFFPNSLPLMKKAKIPRRMAFNAGGYDVWITDLVPFPKARYLPYLYEELLRPLDVKIKNPKANLLLPLKKIQLPKQYIVLHVGTSDPRKEWSSLEWRALAEGLLRQGFNVVFTGKGNRDHGLIKEAFLGLSGLVLCDQLEVDQLALVIKQAQAVISIDSLPVHLASLFEIPFIALYLYSESLELWLPENEVCALLIGSRCSRLNTNENHPKALYVEDIKASDVLTQFSILKKEF